ncbi:tetratricopeptide repeat protein [Streptomyces sp. NPDC059101]|uniref:tetratricopeptide repeat protein n=1 Tax=Streptomyces sp. NPDC059101 TaxID=3346728 RepID=UPI00369D792D
MIRTLTVLCTRHAWKVIALWAVLGLTLGVVSPLLMSRVTQSPSGDFLPPSYDSAIALRIAKEHFGVKPDATTVTVLVARTDGKALSAAEQQQVAAEAAKLGQRRVVMPRRQGEPAFMATDHSQTPRIAPAMTAPDRSFTLLSVELTGNAAQEGVQGVYRAFRDDARARFAELGMRTGFTGPLAQIADAADDHRSATMLGSALVTLLIVLLNALVFRSALAAVLPLLAVAVIGGAAGGAVAGAASLTGLKLDRRHLAAHPGHHIAKRGCPAHGRTAPHQDLHEPSRGCPRPCPSWGEDGGVAVGGAAGVRGSQLCDRPISRIENGKVAPTIDFARRCDELLGTDGELVALVQPTAHPRTRPVQLPPAPSRYVARRSVIESLNEMVETAADAQRGLTLAIDGPAGVGKSALAVHWSRAAAQRFPGGVLFTNLQGYSDAEPVRPAHVLERHLTALGVPSDSIPPTLDERAATLRTIAQERALLLVLDNATDSAHVRPLLLGTPGSVTLVTSRRRLTGLATTSGAQRRSLSPLTPPEARHLLRSIVGHRIDEEPEAAARLAARCAHLPLALRIVAERLATHTHRRVADVVEELDDDALDALADPDDPQLNIRPILDSSYRALPDDQAGPFRLLGLYPAAEFSAAAAGALLDLPAVRARRILDALVAVHLLEDAGPDRYQRHDLLREYAAERCAEIDSEEVRTAAVRRLTAWFAHSVDEACWRMAPQRPIERLGLPPGGVVPTTFVTAQAAESWCDAEAESFLPIVRLAARHQLPDAWEIPARLWNWVLLRKPWSLWIETHRIGLEAATTAGNTARRAWLAMNLGEAYRQFGDTDRARDHIQLSLDLRRDLGDRHGQAWSSTCLGFTARDEDDHPASRPHLEAGLALFEERGDRHGRAVALANLAEAYARLGDRPRAVVAFDASLALAREMGDHYAEGELWARRAAGHRQEGCYAAAATCLGHAIESRRAAGDAWGVAEALEQQGDVLARQGLDAKARQSWQLACEAFDALSSARAVDLRHRLRS